METEAAGEQPVAVGIVKHVARPSAHAGDGPRHQIGPELEIGAGVADHGRLAGGAGGGMQPDELLARHREQAERVGVAQIGLDRKREAREVGEGAEVIGPHARSIELLPDVRDLGIGARDRLLQTTQLQRRELVARHGFGRAIELEAVIPAVGARHRFSPIARRSAPPLP
jgi:hypothetical protein